MTDEEKAVRKQFRLLYDDYWDEKSKNRKSLFDLLLGFTLQVHREARQEGREEKGRELQLFYQKQTTRAYKQGYEACRKKYECRCYCHKEGFAGDISQHKCC